MAHIFALQGRANSGKTTSIILLHDMLIGEGWSVVPGMRKNFGPDFLDVFEKDGIRLGITSIGDKYHDVVAKLKELIEKQCELIFCACRTCDKRRNSNGELEGTVAATKQLSTSVEYHSKSVADRVTDQYPANESDGLRLIYALRFYLAEN